MNVPTKDIIAEIRKRAILIYEAENPKPVEIIQEPIQEQITEPIKEEIKIVDVEEIKDICFGVYRITGELSQLQSVSKFLKDNGITYTVIDQGRL